MISTDIKALNAISPGNPNRVLGPSLMTTAPYPLYYRKITKCGCTFIMNVLYYLNYDRINQNPLQVHKNNHIIPKADAATNQDITNSPYAFVIIRDPVKRFMSLYFDKLYGHPRSSETYNLGEYFTKNGLITNDIGSDAVKHRENCIRTILWIKQNLAGNTDQAMNWHWKPQKIRLRQVHPLRFKVLMLEDINFQLPFVLSPLIPHIADAMKTVSAQNVSDKPVQPKEVLNDELCNLIQDTYPDDTKIYQEVSAYWRNFKEEQ